MKIKLFLLSMLFIIVYLVFSFIEWDIDISQWHEMTRTISGLFILVGSIFILSYND